MRFKHSSSSRKNHRPHGAHSGLAPADMNYVNCGCLLTKKMKKGDRLSKKIIRPLKFNIRGYVRRAVKVSPFHKSY